MDFQHWNNLREADYKGQEVRELVGKPFHMTADHEIVYLDGQTPPTDEEIDAEVKRLQAEFNALQYQRDREPNYPNLAEQFDLLWHAIDADTLDKTSDFYTTLKAVKDAHPKG